MLINNRGGISIKNLKILFLFFVIASLLLVSGCTDSSENGPDSSGPGLDEAAETPSVSEPPESPESPEDNSENVEDVEEKMQVLPDNVELFSEGQTYPVYITAPAGEGKYPGLVLLHSFNGFEPGYRTIMELMASEGYVVVAPHWQTHSTSPSDAEVEALVRESVEYLQERRDVAPERLGLTGFCAGGRYTMLFLPQVKEFGAGVAWYGFPYSGGEGGRPQKPADLIEGLDDPMLMLHGSRDQAINVSDIYVYAGELDKADKYFELKVYQGEPHGFMLNESGELSESFVAQDAYREMMNFFDRTLA